MAVVDLVMPKLGESIMEATVLNWLKQPGDYVEADEFILEVATDKIDTEVPSPVAGYLQKILVPVGSVATIGKAICVIDAVTTETPSTTDSFSLDETMSALIDLTVGSSELSTEKSTNPWISPLIKQICQSENVSQRELNQLPGSGLDGRITKKDVLNYIAVRNSKRMISSGTLSQGAGMRLPGDEVIEMDRMRKMISERMLDSKRIAPHVTSFLEADVTNMVKWRDKIKKDFEKREGEKLTFMPIFVKAVVKAIQDFPMINVSVDEKNIIVHQDINVGMATALPNGNSLGEPSPSRYTSVYDLVDKCGFCPCTFSISISRFCTISLNSDSDCGYIHNDITFVVNHTLPVIS